jgi:predicted nucleic acid-binding Zn ribbon protein
LAFCPFSFGHCVVCSSSIYGFWLPLWYHLAIVLSVLLRFTASDYPFGIFWPLCCLFFFDLQLLITLLVSFGHCVVCSSSIYGFWLPFGIFRPLCCLFFFDLRLLITPLVSFGHCVVCSSSIYGFWLPLWYLVAIVLFVLLWFTDSDYPFGIFWPLCCLFFFDLRLLITPLVSFDHCVVCPSSIYSFWLPLWLLLAIVFSVLLRFSVSDYSFGIFWPLCCLFFFDLRILITPLVSSSFSYGLFTSKRHVFKKPTDLRMGVYDLWYHESMEETDIHVHRFL